MGLGWIAAVPAILGAFKSSKGSSAPPAAPTIQLTPEQQALQDQLTKLSAANLKMAFAELTGGLDLEKYSNMHDALEFRDTFEYRQNLAKDSLNRSAVEMAKAKFPGSDAASVDKRQALATALKMASQGDYEQLSKPMLAGSLGQINPYEMLTGMEELPITVEGKSVPLKTFFSIPQVQAEAMKKDIERRVASGDPNEAQVRWLRDNLLPGLEQQALRTDPFKQYIGNADYQKESGQTVEQFNRTLSDIGLFDPERGIYYRDFEQAKAANGGKMMETADVNGLLAYRLQLESRGKLEEGKLIEDNIAESFPAYHKKYFDEEKGYYNANAGSKFKQYLAPKLESNLADKFSQTFDQLLTKPANSTIKSTQLLDAAENAANRTGQMIQEAVTSGANTRQKLDAFLQQKLQEGSTTPDEFRKASQMLDSVPGFVEKVSQLDPTQQINQIKDLATQMAGAAGAIDTDQNLGGPDARKVAAQDQLSRPTQVGPVSTSNQQAAANQLRQLATDPGIGSAAEAERVAAMNRLDLSTRQRAMSQEEQLAKRGATGSSLGDVQRARLLSEVQDQQGDIEAKFMEQARLAREAEAGVRTGAATGLGSLGTTMTGQEIGRQQWNAENVRESLSAVMASVDQDTQNRLAGENLDLNAIAQKLNATNGSIEAMNQVLQTEIGIPQAQADAILKAGQGMAGVGTAIQQGQTASTEAATNLLGAGSDFVNQSQNTQISAAEAQGKVAEILAGLGDKAQNLSQNEINQFATLVQWGIPAEEMRLKIEEYNQTEPFRRELILEDMMRGAMSGAQGTINSAFGNQATASQSNYANAMSNWNAQQQANAAKANSWATAGQALVGIFRSPAAPNRSISTSPQQPSLAPPLETGMRQMSDGAAPVVGQVLNPGTRSERVVTRADLADWKAKSAGGNTAPQMSPEEAQKMAQSFSDLAGNGSPLTANASGGNHANPGAQYAAQMNQANAQKQPGQPGQPNMFGSIGAQMQGLVTAPGAPQKMPAARQTQTQTQTQGPQAKNMNPQQPNQPKRPNGGKGYWF